MFQVVQLRVFVQSLPPKAYQDRFCDLLSLWLQLHLANEMLNMVPEVAHVHEVLLEDVLAAGHVHGCCPGGGEGGGHSDRHGRNRLTCLLLHHHPPPPTLQFVHSPTPIAATRSLRLYLEYEMLTLSLSVL